MQVVGKDVGILVYGAILEDILLARAQHIERLLDAATQERNLQLEGPAVHILVEVTDIRIITLLIVGFCPVTACKNLRQRSLAASDISCYCYIHILFFIYFCSTIARYLLQAIPIRASLKCVSPVMRGTLRRCSLCCQR